MSVAEIKQLPLSEKLLIMEAIWEDMRIRAEHFDVPERHRDLLDRRRAGVASGEVKLHNWDSVKDRIGRQ